MSLIDALASNEATIPDIQELLAYINHGFGGAQKYAQMLVEDVKAAPPGSTPRLSFHNSYLISIAKFGGDDDLPGKSIEELEKLAQRLKGPTQEKEPAADGENA